jgi:lipid-binding SYLF domain-containing protein
MTGGSWGAQIGGQAVDLVMLVMNDKGMNDMLSANFNFGGDASAAAGPVGRDASATTDWKFKSEVLTYSRARGLYAGAILKGASLRQDDDSTIAFYGRPTGFRSILMGDVTAPSNPSAERFLATVRHDHHEAVQGR